MDARESVGLFRDFENALPVEVAFEALDHAQAPGEGEDKIGVSSLRGEFAGALSFLCAKGKSFVNPCDSILQDRLSHMSYSVKSRIDVAFSRVAEGFVTSRGDRIFVCLAG